MRFAGQSGKRRHRQAGPTFHVTSASVSSPPLRKKFKIPALRSSLPDFRYLAAAGALNSSASFPRLLVGCRCRRGHVYAETHSIPPLDASGGRRERWWGRQGDPCAAGQEARRARQRNEWRRRGSGRTAAPGSSPEPRRAPRYLTFLMLLLCSY
jgi:hypothetical protein